MTDLEVQASQEVEGTIEQSVVTVKCQEQEVEMMVEVVLLGPTCCSSDSESMLLRHAWEMMEHEKASEEA